MLVIACPNCGPRTEPELLWGGEDGVVRPADPAAADDAAWTGYLYLRGNRRGLQIEHWCCAAGCGTWFRVLRDTVTHEIRDVRRFDEAFP